MTGPKNKNTQMFRHKDNDDNNNLRLSPSRMINESGSKNGSPNRMRDIFMKTRNTTNLKVDMRQTQSFQSH